MTPPSIAIQLKSLRQPFRKALATAGRCGVGAIEVDLRTELRLEDLSETALRQIRKMLEENNLRIVSAAYPTRRGYSDLAELDRRVEATKRAMVAAQKLGSNVLINHLGRVPPEEETAFGQFVEVVGDLGAYGNRVGATLAAETGAEGPETLLNLIKALPEGLLGVNFNPGNLAMAGHDTSSAAEQLRRHIVHVRIRDAVRDFASGKTVEVPLGRGAVDFPTILGHLEEANYRGFLTVVNQSSEQPEVDLANAVEYLRNLQQ